MKTFFSEDHLKRDAKTELSGGQLIRPFECPERMAVITEELAKRGFDTPLPPQDHGLEPILAIHDADYVTFLQSAWEAWQAEGFAGEAIATCWPARRMNPRIPTHIDGKLGYYALAAETAISDGTWEAAYSAAQVALTGAAEIASGAREAFALCRPPGHHAALDMYGGYCFLNNAAIAAQALRASGADRVAILDVDFHHGNGTQDIFYAREDVLFLSLHGAPEEAFPHFLGYADETGAGAGAGFTQNYPLPSGTGFGPWREALADAMSRLAAFKAEALVVSLGVDTFEKDPISFFKLTSEDFAAYGGDIGAAGLPTLFVMEGGYAIAEIGINTANTLQGFLNAR